MLCCGTRSRLGVARPLSLNEYHGTEQRESSSVRGARWIAPDRGFQGTENMEGFDGPGCKWPQGALGCVLRVSSYTSMKLIFNNAFFDLDNPLSSAVTL